MSATAITVLDADECDDNSPTLTWLRPVFFGTAIPPHSAELPLPVQRASDLVTTVVETPRPRSKP